MGFRDRMGSRFFDKRMLKYIDWLLILNITAIVLWGVVAIANASSSAFTGDESTLTEFLDKINWNYIGLQLLWFAIGLCVMFVMMIPDYGSVGEYYKWIYWINVGLLVLVLVVNYLSNSSQRGTMRWFEIGERGFQPTEVAKIAITITLAKLFSDKTKKGNITKVRELFPILATFGLPFFLIIIQPDLGTALAYAAIFFGILFVSKTSLKVIGIMVLTTIVVLPLLWFIMNEDQQSRILVYLDPQMDPSGKGYQVEQGKIAIGSGQLSGKGLFAAGAMGALSYIPDRHTDFIFSVTVESLGFVGGVILIGLYFLLLVRTLFLAAQAKDQFGTYIIVGVTCMFFFHIFENIGMTIGLMPVTGIPLPFFSYGGSSMLTCMMAYGLVMNVSMRRQRWSL